MFATAILALASLLPLHDGSFSRSVVDVDGRDLRHELRVQAWTVIETIPSIDPDGDLLLSEEELENAREEIIWYLRQNYRFFPNDEQAQPLRAKVAGFERVIDGSPGWPGNHWLHVDLEYSSLNRLATVIAEESLFETSNPGHLEYLSIAWTGQEPSHHVFRGSERKRSFEATGREARGLWRTFFDMGLGHILSGWDHLLFLVALLAGVKSVRSLAGVVTAFTLAHSLTLAIAALEWVSLPGSFVEIAIALSIVYVAAENLMKLEKRSLWIEALVFGLLHGLGFAGFLGDALRREDALLLPLFGFNVGVEAGQLLVVIPIALVFHVATRKREALEGVEPRLVPVGLGKLISMAVIAVGLFWFAERAGFIG